ncbi:MAG: hypothetical protein WCX65_14015 [bacterium]
MAKQQRAFILSSDASGKKSNLDELNKLLKDGWEVDEVEPMGGGGEATRFASVLILEKEEKEKPAKSKKKKKK